MFDFKHTHDYSHDLTNEWQIVVNFINEAYPYTIGVKNAIDDVWGHLEALFSKQSESQIRQTINKFIDTYIQEKIEFAQRQIVNVGKELVSKRKKEQIMVMGTTTIFDELFS